MPAVLVEVGFMTNPNDLQTMRSPEGRDKIAANLLKAIQTFKKRYDNSTSTTTAPQKTEQADVKPAPETKDTAATPAVEAAPETSGILYGVQVLATSKKMKPTDPFFKGYTPTEVVSGKLYKYIIVVNSDLAEVRRKKKELNQKFPGCFIVSKEGETITRIQ
jgi:N-acetylmuramoyl-L-alanine amidase